MRRWVEFAFHDEQRFELLLVAFAAIKQAKTNNHSPASDDPSWLNFFDAAARSTFWWPTEAERKDWQQRWLATPIPQRWHDPSLRTPWGFSSMIEAFFNGEYELIVCLRTAPDRGRVYYEPHAWPFGGTGCIRALIESFGFEIVQEDE